MLARDRCAAADQALWGLVGIVSGADIDKRVARVDGEQESSLTWRAFIPIARSERRETACATSVVEEVEHESSASGRS